MNRALGALVVALAGCGSSVAGQAPAATPPPHLIVRIADVTDCGGSGTTCPELTDSRRVRVGLDGSLHPFTGRPLRVAPGPGPRSWGVQLDAKRVQVRRPGQAVALLELPLRGFGHNPRLSWSPSGQRFSVLEDFDAARSDAVLVVDPAHRRSWRLPLARGVREIWALAWTDDGRLVAEIIGRDEVLRLVALDAVTGRVLRSRLLDHVFQEIAWSSSARRLAVEDSESRVGVLALTHPTDISWTQLKGVPTWSPDGTRILATRVEDNYGGGELPVMSDGIDTLYPTMETWPGLAPVKLPDDLAGGIWLPEGHALVGLQGDVTETAQAPAKLVQIGETGQVERVIAVSWPPRTGPDDELSLGPTAIPYLIEGLDRLGA
jgi:hypothetical protein